MTALVEKTLPCDTCGETATRTKHKQCATQVTHDRAKYRKLIHPLFKDTYVCADGHVTERLTGDDE